MNGDKMQLEGNETSGSWITGARHETLLPGSVWHNEIEPLLGHRIIQLLAPRLSLNPALYSAVRRKLGDSFADRYPELAKLSQTPQVCSSRSYSPDVDQESHDLLEWVASQVMFDFTRQSSTGDGTIPACASMKETPSINDQPQHDQTGSKAASQTNSHASPHTLLHRQFSVSTAVHPTQASSSVSLNRFYEQCKEATECRMERALVKASEMNTFSGEPDTQKSRKFPLLSPTASQEMPRLKDKTSLGQDRREANSLSPTILSCLDNAPHCLPWLCDQLSGRFLPHAIRWKLWIHCILQVPLTVSSSGKTLPSVNIPNSLEGRLATAVDVFDTFLAEGHRKLDIGADALQAPNSEALASSLQHVYHIAPALASMVNIAPAQSTDCERGAARRDKAHIFSLEVLNIHQIASCAMPASSVMHASVDFSMEAVLVSVMVMVMVLSRRKTGMSTVDVAAVLYTCQAGLLPASSTLHTIARDIGRRLKVSDALLFDHVGKIMELATPLTVGIAVSVQVQRAHDVENHYDGNVEALINKWLSEMFSSLLGVDALLFAWDQLLLAKFSPQIYCRITMSLFSILKEEMLRVRTPRDFKQLLHIAPSILTFSALYIAYHRGARP